MIRLAFVGSQRKIIRFHINGNIVIYFDDIWKDGVQIYPKDQSLIERLKHSDKSNLKMMAALLIDANSGKDLLEYKSCNGSEDKISEFIIKDCVSKGLMQIK